MIIKIIIINIKMNPIIVFFMAYLQCITSFVPSILALTPPVQLGPPTHGKAKLKFIKYVACLLESKVKLSETEDIKIKCH